VEDGHAITARTNGDASGVSNVSAAPPVVHNSPSPGQAAAGEDAVHAQVRKPLHPPMDGVCPSCHGSSTWPHCGPDNFDVSGPRPDCMTSHGLFVEGTVGLLTDLRGQTLRE